MRKSGIVLVPLLIMALVIGTIACDGEEGEGTPTPTPTSTQTPTPTPTQAPDSDGDGWTDAQEQIAGTDPYRVDTDSDGWWDSLDPNPLDPNIPIPATTPTPTPTALFLEIIEPENESTVSTESIIVSGSTISGAVVSISVDTKIEIADVDEQGNFSATVTLAEGPNYIEVLASDQEGNEEYYILVVLYIP